MILYQRNLANYEALPKVPDFSLVTTPIIARIYSDTFSPGEDGEALESESFLLAESTDLASLPELVKEVWTSTVNFVRVVITTDLNKGG